MSHSDALMLSTVLVVDDEVRSQDVIRRTLEDEFHILTASSADEARMVLQNQPVSVILCDQRMPGLTGVQFLKEVRNSWPDVVRIIISGYTDSEDIIAGINDAGIYQYLLKPWLPDNLINAVRGADEARKLQRELHRLDLELRPSMPVLRNRTAEKQAKVQASFDFDRIVRAQGSPMDSVCELAARIAQYDIPVLVLGESGSGKELIARAIHYTSPRASQAFVMENCAAMTDTLLESELFGHKRGSFTGAYEDHIGIFQRANGGTVFLDEVGDTSPAFQVKLLRVLQEGEVRPVGATQSIPVNVRVVAATHRNLDEAIRAGQFREDLYYRLAGMPLMMPPLRERPGDISLIAQSLLRQASEDLNIPLKQLSPDAISALLTYPWPGNIRELRNEIIRAAVLMAKENTDTITARIFSARVLQGLAGPATQGNERFAMASMPQTGTLQERLDAMEAVILKETLLRLRWNKSQAARELGLSRVGLRNKLVRLGLENK